MSSAEYERLANVDSEVLAAAEVKLRESRKRYKAEKDRGAYTFRLRPGKAAELRGYHTEYNTACQQNGYLTIPFNQFVAEFATIGFLHWRAKNSEINRGK
jgi:hypothetical protein